MTSSTQRVTDIRAAGRRAAATARARLAAAAALALAGLLPAAAAHAADAQVKGAKVARGTATFKQDGSTTVIRASNRAVINYKQFDVPSGAGVRFVQPSERATVLNRIQGGAPSRIDGSVTANGRVLFVNPSGVVFGPDARVKAAGFTAAAANISDDDFARGVHRFGPGTGTVTNQGRIEAGEVHLFGQQVTNGGTIKADGGLVTLTAGGGLLVGERDGTTMVRVDPAAGPVGPGTGAVGDLYSLAIKRGGTVTAKDVVVEAGAGAGSVKIEGKIDATSAGGTGGRVTVTGDKVALVGATIDASGPTGGGTVLVGGGFRGAGDLRHAEATFVDGSSILRADATSNGDGGTVVAWGVVGTRVRGLLSAQAGELGGNGGTVETSGGYLDTAGATIQVGAPAGRGGTWLLDPTEIVIRSAASFAARGDAPLGPSLPDADAATAGLQFRPTARSLITTESIQTQLNAGNSVEINASAGPTGLGSSDFIGTISVGSTITKSVLSPAEQANGTPTLLLVAPRLINFLGTHYEGTEVIDDHGGINVTAGKLNVVLRVSEVAGPNYATSSTDVGRILIVGNGIRTNGGSFRAEVLDAAGKAISLENNNVPGLLSGQRNQFVVAQSDPTLDVNPGVPGVQSATSSGGAIFTGGGTIDIDVPRAITLSGPVDSGGGNITIRTTGGIGEPFNSSPIISTYSIDSGGGAIDIRATFDLRVRTLLSGGGAVTLIANDRKTDTFNPATGGPTAGKFDLIGPLYSPSGVALPEPRIDAGTGPIVVRAATVTMSSSVKGGSIDIETDPLDANGTFTGDGQVSVYGRLNVPTGAGVGPPVVLDAGTGDLRIKGTSIILSDVTLVGGRQELAIVDKPIEWARAASKFQVRDTDPTRTGRPAGNPRFDETQPLDDVDEDPDRANLRFTKPSGIYLSGDIKFDGRAAPNGDRGEVIVGGPVLGSSAGTIAIQNPANGELLPPIDTGPTRLSVTHRRGEKVNVTFARSIGGPMAVDVDAGGNVTFADAVGRFPQLVGGTLTDRVPATDPFGPTQYFAGARLQAADVAVSSLRVRGDQVTFGSKRPVTYSGSVLTRPDGPARLDDHGRLRSAGDVLVTGDLAVTGNAIKFRGSDIDVVAGGRIAFSDVPQAGSSVVFSAPGAGTSPPEALTGFDVRDAELPKVLPGAFQLQPTSGGGGFFNLGFGDAPVFVFGGVPTLNATVASLPFESQFATRSVAEVIAGANPPLVRRAERVSAATGSQRAALRSLGIKSRDVQPAEANEALVLGRARYDDFDWNRGRDDPQTFEIASPRIPAAQAAAAIDAYQPLGDDKERAARKQNMQSAWDAYARSAGEAKATGAGFRQFLASDAARRGDAATVKANENALDTLDKLQALQGRINNLALNEVFRKNSEDSLITAFGPEGVDEAVFKEAIGKPPAATTTPTPAMSPAPTPAPGVAPTPTPEPRPAPGK